MKFENFWYMFFSNIRDQNYFVYKSGLINTYNARHPKIAWPYGTPSTRLIIVAALVGYELFFGKEVFSNRAQLQVSQ